MDVEHVLSVVIFQNQHKSHLNSSFSYVKAVKSCTVHGVVQSGGMWASCFSIDQKYRALANNIHWPLIVLGD